MTTKLISIFLLCQISIGKTQLDCSNVPVICRDGWGSLYPIGGKSMPIISDKVFYIHTVTEECSDKTACEGQLRSIQEYHVSTLGFDDIGYNFVIGGDGNVYEGRGWNRIGAHTKGHNTGSIGIAFIGDYSKNDPSAEMLKAARDLIVCGVISGNLNRDYGLYGHRDATCTNSPGNYFYVTLRSFAQWHAQEICNFRRTQLLCNL